MNWDITHASEELLKIDFDEYIGFDDSRIIHICDEMELNWKQQGHSK